MTRSLTLCLALLLVGCDRGAPDPQASSTPVAPAASVEAGAVVPQAAAATEDVVVLPEAAQRAVRLEVAAVQRTVVVGQQQVLGQITFRPETETIVHAPIAGRITRVHVAVGDRVRAGAPLVTVASAELGEAQAAFLQAHGERRLAQDGHTRERRLFADGLTSKKELDAAAQALAASRVRLLAAREKLRVLGETDGGAAALVRRERVDVSQVIRAVRSGTVVERGVALGDLASPQDEQPMFKLYDLSTVRIEADLPERDLLAVETGQAATITLPALGDRVVQGTVVRLAPVLDRESRTGRALIDVPNPNGALKPGMSCKVAIATARRHVLGVPAAAVQREAQQAFVFIALGGDRFRERAVTLGERHGDLFEVRAGLVAGERVVVRGSFDLRSEARKATFGGA